MHPLMPNLTELSDEQLTEKITKILERMVYANRTGHTSTYQQINNIYQDLLLEQQDRVIRKQKQLAEKGEEDPFEGLINVKKR